MNGVMPSDSYGQSCDNWMHDGNGYGNLQGYDVNCDMHGERLFPQYDEYGNLIGYIDSFGNWR